jgi:hypothetical protein
LNFTPLPSLEHHTPAQAMVAYAPRSAWVPTAALPAPHLLDSLRESLEYKLYVKNATPTRITSPALAVGTKVKVLRLTWCGEREKLQSHWVGPGVIEQVNKHTGCAIVKLGGHTKSVLLSACKQYFDPLPDDLPSAPDSPPDPAVHPPVAADPPGAAGDEALAPPGPAGDEPAGRPRRQCVRQRCGFNGCQKWGYNKCGQRRCTEHCSLLRCRANQHRLPDHDVAELEAEDETVVELHEIVEVLPDSPVPQPWCDETLLTQGALNPPRTHPICSQGAEFPREPALAASSLGRCAGPPLLPTEHGGGFGPGTLQPVVREGASPAPQPGSPMACPTCPSAHRCLMTVSEERPCPHLIAVMKK